MKPLTLTRRTRSKGATQVLSALMPAVVLAIVGIGSLSTATQSSKLRYIEPPARLDTGPSQHLVPPPASAVPVPTPTPTPAANGWSARCCPVGSLALACRVADVRFLLFRHLTFIGDAAYRLPPVPCGCSGRMSITDWRFCHPHLFLVA